MMCSKQRMLAALAGLTVTGCATSSGGELARVASRNPQLADGALAVGLPPSKSRVQPATNVESQAAPATTPVRVASRHGASDGPLQPAWLLVTDPPRCPQEMALVLDRVCVDRWESSVVLVLAGGIEKSWSPFRTPEDAAGTLRAVSRPGVIPQGHISGEQAERACAASGKRLCSADEWEAACRGPARTTYPYGDARQSQACNDDGRRIHPVAEVNKALRLPEDRMWYEGMDHPLINQLPHTLRKTGERASCTNDYGVFDMVGNLHEWIDDPDGTFRGGYYLDTVRNGEGCKYATTAHSKKYHDYSTGFRCCMDPDSVE